MMNFHQKPIFALGDVDHAVHEVQRQARGHAALVQDVPVPGRQARAGPARGRVPRVREEELREGVAGLAPDQPDLEGCCDSFLRCFKVSEAGCSEWRAVLSRISQTKSLEMGFTVCYGCFKPFEDRV